MLKIISFFTLLFLSIFAHADVVLLNANESPPYWSRNLPFNGLGGEIIAAISNAADLESHIEFMPLKRLIEDTSMNELGNPAFYMQNQEYAAIIPIAISQVSLFSCNCNSQQKNPIQFKTISDLKGYRIGVLSGSILNKKAFEQVGIKFETSYTQESLFKKLHYGRLDLVLEIDVVGRQMITKLFPNERGKFFEAQLPQTIAPIAIMLDKNYPNAKLIGQRYQQGLNEIIKNGRYAEIIESYYQQKPSDSWFKALKRFTQLYKIEMD